MTADTYPGIYAVGFAEAAAAPPFAESEEGKAYFAAIDEYAQGTDQDGKAFPHCIWSWIGAQILEEAFKKMEEPTREAFYAALTSISGFEAQFAFGPIDTTDRRTARDPDGVAAEVQRRGLRQRGGRRVIGDPRP